MAKAWSDEARRAALEARREKEKSTTKPGLGLMAPGLGAMAAVGAGAAAGYAARSKPAGTVAIGAGTIVGGIRGALQGARAARRRVNYVRSLRPGVVPLIGGAAGYALYQLSQLKDEAQSNYNALKVAPAIVKQRFPGGRKEPRPASLGFKDYSGPVDPPDDPHSSAWLAQLKAPNVGRLKGESGTMRKPSLVCKAIC
jgi:hypothetical protein